MESDKNTILKFLEESNKIEGVFGNEALKDAYKAWKYAVKHVDDMNIEHVLGIHKRLLGRLDPFIAGKIRNCDVYIGGRCCMFISVQLIEEDINKVIKMMNYFNDEDIWKEREAMAKHAHIEFEYVHPFVDGNGRVGRILYNIHRIKLGLPIHVIHTGQEQYKYYKWFKQR